LPFTIFNFSGGRLTFLLEVIERGLTIDEKIIEGNVFFGGCPVFDDLLIFEFVSCVDLLFAFVCL
jgi:hypothetical protein